MGINKLLRASLGIALMLGSAAELATATVGLPTRVSSARLYALR